MLALSKISHTGAHTDQWKKQKLGCISASQFGKLIGTGSHEGRFTTGAITYLENVAGERITGTPAKAEFHTDYTDFGNATEPEAISHFETTTSKVVFRDTERSDTHRLIVHNEYSCCTPDALVAMASLKEIFDVTGNYMKVAPFEAKCPSVLNKFIKLYRCITPADLKKVEPLYYWQVITQMAFCDSLNAYFAVYNSNFPKPMRIIEFKKGALVEDLKIHQSTLKYAIFELEQIINLLK